MTDVWPESRTRVLCDAVIVQLPIHEICAGQPARKDSREQTQNIALIFSSHLPHLNPFAFLPWLSIKVGNNKKNCTPQKGQERRKILLQTCCSILVQNFILPFFFFWKSNLVWQIKAQLIFKSACSQLSHPVALSLGNIIEAHTIYTKVISFPQACQGDALGEPKIWQKEIYVQLLHIISHYDSPQSFNFKNKRPL